MLAITPAHHLDPPLHDCLYQAEALAEDNDCDYVVEDHKIAQNRNDLERAIERLAEQVACHALVLLKFRHLRVLVRQNFLGVGVRVLPHRLRVNEENHKCNRHDKVVASHVQKQGLLEVQFNVHVAPNLDDQFSAGNPSQENIPLVKANIASVFNDQGQVLFIVCRIKESNPVRQQRHRDQNEHTHPKERHSVLDLHQHFRRALSRILADVLTVPH